MSKCAIRNAGWRFCFEEGELRKMIDCAICVLLRANGGEQVSVIWMRTRDYVNFFDGVFPLVIRWLTYTGGAGVSGAYQFRRLDRLEFGVFVANKATASVARNGFSSSPRNANPVPVQICCNSWRRHTRGLVKSIFEGKGKTCEHHSYTRCRRHLGLYKPIVS